jgi:outer membrane protein assembly factor BamB
MSRFVLLCCLGWVGLLSAATPFPGGVMDESEQTAFVPTEEGVEALDLETGLTRWRNSQATCPLFVSGEQVYALSLQRGRMAIQGLSLSDKGTRTYESDWLELPTWVDASSMRGAWTLNKRTLTFAWQARGTLGKSSQGCFTLNLSETKWSSTKEGCPAVEKPLPALLQREPVRWHRSIAGHLHAVVEEDGPMSTLLRRKKKLVLRVWNETSGKETRAVELLTATRPMILPGLDGRHVWVREGGTFDAPGDSSPWQVFSVLDGHAVARVTFVAGTSQATLVGTRAYGMVTRTSRVLLEGKTGRRHELYAVDVETGKVLWRKPVRESIASPR